MPSTQRITRSRSRSDVDRQRTSRKDTSATKEHKRRHRDNSSSDDDHKHRKSSRKQRESASPEEKRKSSLTATLSNCTDIGSSRVEQKRELPTVAAQEPKSFGNIGLKFTAADGSHNRGPTTTLPEENMDHLGNFELFPEISEPSRKNLISRGITRLFPVQYMTFKRIYAHEDLMVRDLTGSGKTLGFCLPMVEMFRN